MEHYTNLIQTNPIVPFKVYGYASDHWCNYDILTDASVKKFQVSVFANTANDARFYAEQLKNHIKSNPMMNEYINQPDDISIGVKQPVLDQMSSAYRIDMIMLTGALTI